MTTQTRTPQAALEDAQEEEQRIPKAGDILTEEQAFFLKNQREIVEQLVLARIKERQQMNQLLQENEENKRRADEMAEEARRAHAEIRRKDEIIHWKDEEINRMRAESERKDAAYAEELNRMRAENLAIRKAAVTYLHEATSSDNRKTTFTSHTIPSTLNTPQAKSLIQRLIDGQILDGYWQPINLSNAEKGILAGYLSGELDVKNPWQSFASLWGMKPETLRRAAARAMEQRRTLGFQDRLKGLLRA